MNAFILIQFYVYVLFFVRYDLSFSLLKDHMYLVNLNQCPDMLLVDSMGLNSSSSFVNPWYVVSWFFGIEQIILICKPHFWLIKLLLNFWILCVWVNLNHMSLVLNTNSPVFCLQMDSNDKTNPLHGRTKVVPLKILCVSRCIKSFLTF